MWTVALLAERAWQPEMGEQAAVAEPGDGGDAVALEGFQSAFIVIVALAALAVMAALKLLRLSTPASGCR
jgi:hypothetical protein